MLPKVSPNDPPTQEPTTFISIGAGSKNPNAEIIEVADIPTFLASHNVMEAWWSGYLWEPSRRATANWLACSVVVLDIDYYNENGDALKRHVAPPDGARRALDEVNLPCTFWHHTPRGARVAFVLETPCFDADVVKRAEEGAVAVIEGVLREEGCLARRDKKGRPMGGYARDEATKDLARFYFAPTTAILDRKTDALVPRNAPINTVSSAFPIEDLLGYAPEARLPEDESPEELDSEEEAEISEKIAKLPCEGENDGSSLLIRAARKAIGLGVKTPEVFVRVAKQWNAQRRQPWSDEDLAKRFTDAKARWSERGIAQVPADYRRASLEAILQEDRRYAERFSWDERDLIVRMNGKVFGDSALGKLETEICKNYAFQGCPIDALTRAVRNVAEENPVNRVTSYLASLDWDGEPRAAQLVEALGILGEQRDLAATYLQKVLIAAVARAVEPGCKQDNVPVLVGPEGAGKSRFFMILAGPENHRDTAVDLNSKDAYLQLRAAWIYEWSELEAMTKRADVAKVKNFLSSSVDTFRAPYGRVTEEHPRQGIIVGTSNSHDLVLDPDSNRRLWIMEIEEGAFVDLAWVKENRDQLWAEALYRYAAGEKWWLEGEEEALRNENNALYAPDRPLLDRIEEVVPVLLERNGGQDWFKTRDLYSKLGIDPSHGHPALAGTIKSKLYKMGFSRTRVRTEEGRAMAYKRKSKQNGAT